MGRVGRGQYGNTVGPTIRGLLLLLLLRRKYVMDFLTYGVDVVHTGVRILDQYLGGSGRRYRGRGVQFEDLGSACAVDLQRGLRLGKRHLACGNSDGLRVKPNCFDIAVEGTPQKHQELSSLVYPTFIRVWGRQMYNEFPVS
jgi:hypothetical protein